LVADTVLKGYTNRILQTDRPGSLEHKISVCFSILESFVSPRSKFQCGSDFLLQSNIIQPMFGTHLKSMVEEYLNFNQCCGSETKVSDPDPACSKFRIPDSNPDPGFESGSETGPKQKKYGKIRGKKDIISPLALTLFSLSSQVLTWRKIRIFFFLCPSWGEKNITYFPHSVIFWEFTPAQKVMGQ